MRREPTEAEKRLWSILRDRQLAGAHFRRQHPIPPYVADFACVDAQAGRRGRRRPARRRRDAARDAYLERHGWRVLRFWNNEVLTNLEGVAQQIATRCSAPTPTLPAARERALDALPPGAGQGRGGGCSRAPPPSPPTAPPPPPSPSPTTTATAAACASPPTPAGPSSSTSPRPACCATATSSLLDDGRLVLVRAAPEAVLDIQAADALALARIAWHLGNRHTPTQILPGALRIRADHVLEHLLTDHLGATVTHATAPFDPEGGAYGARP